MAFQCENCGKETSLKELKVVEALSGDNPQLCDVCQRLKFNHRFLIGLGIVAVTLVGFYGWRRSSPDSFWLCFIWNLLVIQMFQYVSTIPHEIGHALAARLVGGRVEKIVIGNGRMVANFRFGGLQFDFCSQPFGGAMYPGRLELKGWRWKGVVIWAAGPLANIILGLLAFTWMPDKTTAKFDLGAEVSYWILFIIANVIMTLVSLIPMVITRWPHGPMVNDGMGLVQLIFEGKWPYAPVRQSHVLTMVESPFLSFLKIFFAMLFVILATTLILLSIAHLLSGLGRGNEVLKHLLGSAALVGFAAAIFCLTFRMMRPSPLPVLEPVKKAEEQFQAMISEADWNKNKWPKKISPPILLHNITLLFNSGQFEQGEKEIDEVLRQEPDNFWLLLCKSDTLAAQKRFEEADVLIQRVVDWPGLESGSRVYVTMNRLLLWEHQDKKEQVKTRMAEILTENYSIDEKVWLLDMLSGWPFQLKKMEYLTEAKEWIQTAIRLAPDAITLRGTYGALLYESGELVAAETVLHEVFQNSKAAHDRGISAFYLALLAKKKREWNEARRWLRQAMRWYQEPWMLERADLEFSAEPPSDSKKEPVK